ncbi:MAG: hypothetical protein AAGE01_17645 [Pseudomonadota bacterium]
MSRHSPIPVSLGGGCDVSLYLLAPRKLTPANEFFDHLWNLDRGLVDVRRIIETDFAGFDRPENYVRRHHPEWNTPEKPGRVRLAARDMDTQQVVHAAYPDIAFIHWPDVQELPVRFARKASRFRALLRGDRPLSFIYYRKCDCAAHGRYLVNEDLDVQAKLTLLAEESVAFAECIRSRFPELRFHLLAGFMEARRRHPKVDAAVDAFFAAAPDTDDVTYRRLRCRGDRDWQERWIALERDFARADGRREPTSRWRSPRVST